MNRVNQITHYTEYNRYPNHFAEIRQRTEDSIDILSLGCSTGEEVKALSNIYYKSSYITGYDICADIIDKLNKENKNTNIRYIKELDEKMYDLIMCMSVLCRWPENMGEYTKRDFDEIISEIDKRVKKGGYLCIYNSKYLFEETDEFKNYRIVKTEVTDSGFVQKYKKTGEKIKDYPYYLFQKNQ